MERTKSKIDNEFYHELDEEWYDRWDHPIALLRKENEARIPWILKEIEKRFGRAVKVLDLGAGAGFASNALSTAGHFVTGVDLSEASLEVARRHDKTGRVQYVKADIQDVPFEDQSFDVVMALDVLEHIERPELAISEASRLLRKGGLFFFYTLNRTWLSYIIALKGMEWFVQNTPKDMHLYRMFIRPKEMDKMCRGVALEVDDWMGLIPKMTSVAFLKLLITKKIVPEFKFSQVKSLAICYGGVAIKGDPHRFLFQPISDRADARQSESNLMQI